MKLGWGWKIGILYVGFMGLIVTLVVASNKQHFDLVSKDYYEQEVAYQKVIDDSKNQSSLSQAIDVHANATSVIIEFPDEFKDKILSGDVKFYSPVNSDWDGNFKIMPENNKLSIPRSELHNTKYTVKIHCTVNSKSYYQETEITLH